MSEIRIAVAGVGNCCSSLLQGVYYYGKDEAVGLRHAELAGYKPKDIRFVAAFDIADVKVGKDISEAIWAEPNNVPKFADVPRQKVKVQLGLHQTSSLKMPFPQLSVLKVSL